MVVTDTGNRRVVVLRHTGAELTPERAHGGFLEPLGVTDDGQGGFYVCDRQLNAVLHLDTATGDRTTFGLELAFDRPVAIASVPPDGALARGKRPAVVIVDRDGKRLRSFDPSGARRATVTAETLPVEDARFDAVEIDYYGNVYALDRTHHRVHKFRDDLLPLDTFGREGTGRGEFRSPRGIAIHRRLGQVFVTEADGGRYLWVGTDVKAFEAEDLGDRVDFSFLLTEDSTLGIRILRPDGAEVAVLIPDRRTACGPQRGAWDGTDAAGQRVGDGDYLAEIRARATYASRSTFERKLLEPFTLGRSGEGP